MGKSNLFLFFCTVFLFGLKADGQNTYRRITAGGLDLQVSAADADVNDEFCKVGIMPKFPGGMCSLIAFAKRHIHYPESAVNDNIEGKVELFFIVDKKGRVINTKVTKGVRADLDKPCLKMLNQMPDWKPGKLNGKPVNVKFIWGVIFILTDK